MTNGAAPPRGILGIAGRLPYRLTRIAPPEQLAWCVDRFWISEWDVPDPRVVTARILPHPTVNLTLESGRLMITGVAPGVYTRTLIGRDRAFGIKLRPGAARLLVDVPVRSLSGTGQPAEDLVRDGWALAAALRSAASDQDRVAVFGDHVQTAGLSPDRDLIMVQQAVELLVSAPDVKRVSDVTDRLGTSERRLQRLFAEYLGLTPGWVLRRGRLHAAAERLITLAGRRSEPLAQVAAEFGYADQAHLTNDFRRFIGTPPGSWLAELITEQVSGPSHPITPPT